VGAWCVVVCQENRWGPIMAVIGVIALAMSCLFHLVVHSAGRTYHPSQ